jgi:flagellin
MALSILNNIPSLAAQNQLAITGGNLQRTLFRLSSGSRINTGADDAAGLAIADGLRANITALTQSARNANDGVGKLQVADGALAQVTTLLNRAVTLATESATGTVSDPQRSALNQEFTAIKAEIDRIGSNTTFNGTAVFSTGTAPNLNNETGSQTGLTLTSALTNTSTVIVTSGTASYTFTAGATSTVADLLNGINSDSTVGAKAALIGGQVVIIDPQSRGNVTVTGTETALGTWAHPNATVPTTTSIYLSDSSASGASTIVVSVGALGSTHLDHGSSNISLASDLLDTQAHASAAMADINQAIQNVAGIRGDLGAGINRLQSAVNVIQNQSQNLSAAEDGIRAADIAQEVANMTKFSILNQTGISALAQANTMQQQVLALLR